MKLAMILDDARDSGIYRLHSRRSSTALVRQIETKYPHYTHAILDGDVLDSKTALLDGFAQALAFPEYFGHNWDALEECLMDLSWLEQRNIVVVMEHVTSLIQRDPEQWDTLQAILEEVCASHSQKNRSFVVLLRDTTDALDLPIVTKG